MPIEVIARIVALSAWSESVKILVLYEPPGKMSALLQMGFIGDCPVLDGDEDHEQLLPLSMSMHMPGAHSYRCFCVPFTISRKAHIRGLLKKPVVESSSTDSFMRKALRLAGDRRTYEAYIDKIGSESIIDEYFEKSR